MIEFKSDFDVEMVQSAGSDDAVVHAARVSTGVAWSHDQQDHKRDEGLIRYLMQHRHGTPFEHAVMTFCIRAPIFVWREFHRHRIGFSYNEESGRYKTLDPVFYIPLRTRPMMKVDGWKPGRPKFLACESAVYESLINNLRVSYVLGYNSYLANLDLGIDPGLARDCLPVGIYSQCWVTCNPRSLMHFLSLRTHRPDARKVSYPLWEIEAVANKMEAEFATRFPWTYAAFNSFGREAP